MHLLLSADFFLKKKSGTQSKCQTVWIKMTETAKKTILLNYRKMTIHWSFFRNSFYNSNYIKFLPSDWLMGDFYFDCVISKSVL